MRRFIQIDQSQRPIITITYEPFIPTEEEFIEMQNDLYDIVKNNHQCLILMDLRNLIYLSSKLYVRQAQWIKSNDLFFKREIKGIAFVTQSFVANIAVKATFSIFRPSVPYIIVGNFLKARKWLELKCV